jgi:hypothetical protein
VAAPAAVAIVGDRFRDHCHAVQGFTHCRRQSGLSLGVGNVGERAGNDNVPSQLSGCHGRLRGQQRFIEGGDSLRGQTGAGLRLGNVAQQRRLPGLLVTAIPT